MKSIKAKIVYYNIIKPTYDLIELFSINISSSVYNSVDISVQNFVYYPVRNSVENSVWNSICKSIYKIWNNIK